MRVITDKEEIKADLEELTYQNPFSPTKPCANKSCKGTAPILMIVDDDAGELCGQRPDKARVWPHDSSATAVYLCTTCGEAQVDWNQA